MSESQDMVKDEDTVQLDSTIQLSPHAKTHKLVPVVKTEDTVLISLDELYEVTGQESIRKICKGVEALIKYKKLDKDSVTALKLSGTESFMPGFDRLNAVKGGENFLIKLRDGFLTIIKAIINFIKGTTSWIYNKIKTLFGFGKTAKEIALTQELSKEVNRNMTVVLKALGAGVDFDAAKFYESLPTNYTQKEILTLTKSKLADNKEAIESLASICNDIPKGIDKLAELSVNTKRARSDFRRSMDNLKRRFSSKQVTEGDIVEFADLLDNKIFITLNYEPLYAAISGITEKLYEIDIKNVGMEDGIETLKTKLKAGVEKVKVRVNPEEVANFKKASIAIGDVISKMDQHKVDEDIAKDLADFVRFDDATFIKELTISLPDYVNLESTYLLFSNKMSEYTKTIIMLTELLSEVYWSCFNIVTWWHRTDALVSIFMTNDLNAILEHQKNNLTVVERSKLETPDGKGSTVITNMVGAFNNKYDGINIPEEISNYSAALLELDEGKNYVNNLAKSLGLPMRVR